MSGRDTHEGSECISAAPSGRGSGCTSFVPGAAAELNDLGRPF